MHYVLQNQKKTFKINNTKVNRKKTRANRNKMKKLTGVTVLEKQRKERLLKQPHISRTL